MRTERISIQGIPAVVCGEPSERVFLFVHGQNGSKEEAIDFARRVCPKGWQVVGFDLPEHGERKRETGRFYPWIAVPELQSVWAFLEQSGWNDIALRANSIGAWFCMLALRDKPVCQSLFVSPILNMAHLIEKMMGWAGATKEELEARRTIETDFGQPLSWEYYLYAKQHPINVWNSPTSLLYGGKENLTDRADIDAFAGRFRCDLSIMENGEHWFHTEEQLAVLNGWIERRVQRTKNTRSPSNGNSSSGAEEYTMWFVLIPASFLAALVSGAAGFGGALLLLPVITYYIGAEAAVPVITLAQLIGNISRMASGFRQIKWSAVGWFCLTALPLSALGAVGFTVLPKDIVTRCIGGALVLLVVFKAFKLFELKGNRATLLIGGAVTGGLSGLAGSGGPIGAAVFLSLGLPPVAYIASEAATATAMHLLKTAIYSKLSFLTTETLLLGLSMGAAMVAGTFAANRFIKRMEKGKFQTFVAFLLCIVGLYMLIFGD